MGSSPQGHTRDMPEQKVVTTADPSVVATSPTDNRSRNPRVRGAVSRNLMMLIQMITLHVIHLPLLQFFAFPHAD